MAGLHRGSQRRGRLFQLCIKTCSEEMGQVAQSASNMEQSLATDEDFTAPCDLNQTHLGHHFPLSFLPSLSFLFSESTSATANKVFFCRHLLWVTYSPNKSHGLISRWKETQFISEGKKEMALKGHKKWPKGKIMRTNRALVRKGRSPVTVATQLC